MLPQNDAEVTDYFRFDTSGPPHGDVRAPPGAGMPTRRRPAAYFTAPRVSPPLSRRWNAANTTATGTVATSVAAITWFHSTL